MESSFLFVSSISNLNRSYSPNSTPSSNGKILAVVIIVVPIVLLLTIGLNKRYRARIRRQRVKYLEGLYHQTYKKRKF